jgi:hypothetical protein
MMTLSPLVTKHWNAKEKTCQDAKNNYFQGLKIYFHGLIIYFQGLVIYFQSLKIVLNAVIKCFILRAKKFCIGGIKQKNSHVSQRGSYLVPLSY